MIRVSFVKQNLIESAFCDPLLIIFARLQLASIEYDNRTMAKPFKWTYQGKALVA